MLISQDFQLITQRIWARRLLGLNIGQEAAGYREVKIESDPRNEIKALYM
jgi:hypothetical protein